MEITANDITFVGQPVVTENSGLLVAFFAEFPDGSVVDGSELAAVVVDNSDEIGDAVSPR